MSNETITIFISYSHKDEELRNELEMHLKGLKQNGIISHWHDREILPGDRWDQEIENNLNTAKIILFLVSADFVGSRYCQEKEIQKAMERHRLGQARVIPVILRHCDWQETAFGDLQALPKYGKPVKDKKCWDSTDEAFYDVVVGIKKVAISFSQRELLGVLDDPKISETSDDSNPEEIDPVQDSLQSIQKKIAELQSMGLPDAQSRLIARSGLMLSKAAELGSQTIKQRKDLQISPQEQYLERVKWLIKTECYPFDKSVQHELYKLRQQLNLSEAEVFEFEKTILMSAEDAYEASRSGCGVDHTELRDLLRAKNWRAADHKTYDVMHQALEKELGDYPTTDELIAFPCQDLLAIDHLWKQYSRGKFGFSVQKEIYVECGGNMNGRYPGSKIWKAFGDRVGWYVNETWIDHSNVNFSESAKKGHLPVLEVMPHHAAHFSPHGLGMREWLHLLVLSLLKCES